MSEVNERDVLQRVTDLKDKGNAAFLKGKSGWKEAHEFYTKALDVSSDDEKSSQSVVVELKSKVLSNRALISLNLDNAEDATRDCQRAIKLDSSNVKAWHRLMLALVELVRYQEALDVCKDAMQKFPDKSASFKPHLAAIQRAVIGEKDRNTFLLSASKQSYACYLCGKPGAKLPCAKCGVVFYCDAQCAEKNKAMHRRSCAIFARNNATLAEDDSPVRIRQSSRTGRLSVGIFAVKDIPKASIVLTEKPYLDMDDAVAEMKRERKTKEDMSEAEAIALTIAKVCAKSVEKKIELEALRVSPLPAGDGNDEAPSYTDLCNAFVQNSLGGRLYSMLARLNHSCAPNCITRFSLVGKQKQASLIAQRVIKATEELTITYDVPKSNSDLDCALMLFKDRKQRQDYLKDRYKFQCACELCANVDGDRVVMRYVQLHGDIDKFARLFMGRKDETGTRDATLMYQVERIRHEMIAILDTHFNSWPVARCILEQQTLAKYVRMHPEQRDVAKVFECVRGLLENAAASETLHGSHSIPRVLDLLKKPHLFPPEFLARSEVQKFLQPFQDSLATNSYLLSKSSTGKLIGKIEK